MSPIYIFWRKLKNILLQNVTKPISIATPTTFLDELLTHNHLKRLHTPCRMAKNPFDLKPSLSTTTKWHRLKAIINYGQGSAAARCSALAIVCAQSHYSRWTVCVLRSRCVPSSNRSEIVYSASEPSCYVKHWFIRTQTQKETVESNWQTIAFIIHTKKNL